MARVSGSSLRTELIGNSDRLPLVDHMLFGVHKCRSFLLLHFSSVLQFYPLWSSPKASSTLLSACSTQSPFGRASGPKTRFMTWLKQIAKCHMVEHVLHTHDAQNDKNPLPPPLLLLPLLVSASDATAKNSGDNDIQ